MNKNFGDTSVSIHYFQQMLNENYNSKVFVNGEYYKHFDMNYGFAHYVAKYLEYKYPLLDSESLKEYENLENNDGIYNNTSSIRQIDEKPISILNYFLSDNSGNILQYNPSKSYLDETTNIIYKQIYNQYMILSENSDGYIKPNYEDPNTGLNYLIMNDLPLFSSYSNDTNIFKINNNIIFKLSSWNISKNICEIDDFIASYLFGRTITPQSSMEDIYYVQKLLIHNRNITREEKGVWCIPGAEGTEYDLTQTIIQYQKQKVNFANRYPLFITGYFDIFTESQALKDFGGDSNGIHGL